MRYMVEVTILPSPAIAALIPGEQARVKVLTEQGVIESLYISADRLRVWLVMRAESPQEAHAAMESLPLYPHMQTAITQIG